jgi:N-acetylmuramoyl-L-alanine amidase
VPSKGGVQTVIVDAGHGGDDAGVKGAGGTLEKQVTLDVARRLKTVLESRMGVRVVLTRDDDRLVSPDERTATANNAKGDLLVSLHMSASSSPAMTGAAVYFMRLDREGEETRREAGAQSSSLPVLGGGTRVIETIRWDLAQARHVDDSGRLANLLAAALEGHVPITPQPVQAAPLRVLAGLNMPAVLFEMGYLTNAEQEKRATADDGRSVLVQAIYDAVNRFALANR